MFKSRLFNCILFNYHGFFKTSSPIQSMPKPVRFGTIAHTSPFIRIMVTLFSLSRCFSPLKIRKPLPVVAQVAKANPCPRPLAANAVHPTGVRAVPDSPEPMLNTTPDPKIGRVEGLLAGWQWRSPLPLAVDTGLV